MKNVSVENFIKNYIQHFLFGSRFVEHFCSRQRREKHFFRLKMLSRGNTFFCDDGSERGTLAKDYDFILVAEIISCEKREVKI